MTDLHEVVINYICKVVCWETVIFQDNLIVYVFVIKDDFSMDDILERSLSFWHFHPYYK